jgi:hypothetical protein
MVISSAARNINWWGLGSAGGLFAWFLCWVRNGPQTRKESLFFWGTLALIHFVGVKAARQRFGLVYLIPLGVIWVVIIVALSGGIPPS